MLCVLGSRSMDVCSHTRVIVFALMSNSQQCNASVHLPQQRVHCRSSCCDAAAVSAVPGATSAVHWSDTLQPFLPCTTSSPSQQLLLCHKLLLYPSSMLLTLLMRFLSSLGTCLGAELAARGGVWA